MTKKIEEHKNIYIHIKKETLRVIFIFVIGTIIIVISMISILSLPLHTISSLHQFGLVFTMAYIIFSVCCVLGEFKQNIGIE